MYRLEDTSGAAMDKAKQKCKQNLINYKKILRINKKN